MLDLSESSNADSDRTSLVCIGDLVTISGRFFTTTIDAAEATATLDIKGVIFSATGGLASQGGCEGKRILFAAPSEILDVLEGLSSI